MPTNRSERFRAIGRIHNGSDIVLRTVRNRVTDEWEVRVSIDGRARPELTYFTDDRTDAEDTMRAMRAELGGT